MKAKSILIHNLTIQFDADQNSESSLKEQAEDAIGIINGVLQREPFGMGVQITSLEVNASDVQALDDEGEEIDYEDTEDL